MAETINVGRRPYGPMALWSGGRVVVEVVEVEVGIVQRGLSPGPRHLGSSRPGQARPPEAV